MSRWLGIGFGLATHGLFAVTVWRLFSFLRNPAEGAVAGTLVIDFLLLLQFAVPHSLLLHPAVRKRLSTLIPAPFYGCFYTVVTCLSLWLMFLNWRCSSLVLWQLSGAGGVVMTAGFYASWIALFYSLHLTGLGWQTGLTPWLHWVRGLPPPQRSFQPRGAYHFLRHPVYLSFLGLIWFTPSMTLDHAILTLVWSVYIFYGSYLKDERLAFYMGNTYRAYQAQVAGYPGIFFGPLGKRVRELTQ